MWHFVLQLADLIREAVPKKKYSRIDQATKTFQALRIAVNNELVELSDGLRQATQLLIPGGRLVVLSYHGVEDKLVKRFIKVRM